ncbi:hypothetical protein PFMC_04905, partial [Plasmodium falciparum CAMP/Malaysia]
MKKSYRGLFLYKNNAHYIKFFNKKKKKKKK